MSDNPAEQDPLDYEILIRESLRGVIRRAIDIVAHQGLPGDHYFSITFHTGWDGVVLHPQLLAQYPEQMTIIIQHQFWELSTDEDGFNVTLSFGGRKQPLRIPFAAVTAFVDPGAEFALQLTAVEPTDAAKSEPEPSVETADETTTGRVVSLDAFRRR